MTLQLHNTLTRKTEGFTPINNEKVTLYTCGPTVYGYLHVGNWAAYIYWDTLVRTLLADGYDVERVMNITDVGHLTSDEDEGEDKLQKGARLEGKTAWEIAEFYAEDFLRGMEKLGLITPEHVVRATDFIPQQLDLIRVLKEKGYTYQISDGIYFDTAKFPTYANFAQLDLEAQKAGARVEYNPEKRNPSDFALWKFTAQGEKRDMEWGTPIDLLIPAAASRSATVVRDNLQPEADRAPGPLSDPERSPVSEDSGRKGDQNGNQNKVMGFPGWHLECSAMAMSILDPTIDIHTGGIDHIPVHHTNEIAQSEAASGQTFAHYWLHCNHIKSDGTKISKSLGNGYTLEDLATKGFSPLDYRMFVLQGQYSNEGNFTFENLEAAKNRLAHWRNAAALRHQAHDTIRKQDSSDPSPAVIGAIKEALNNNLNTPEALRLVDDVFSRVGSLHPDKINRQAFVDILETIDSLLGLQLMASTPDISDDTKQLIIEREQARNAKDWQKSDQLRDQLKEHGVVVRDTPGGSVWEYAA